MAVSYSSRGWTSSTIAAKGFCFPVRDGMEQTALAMATKLRTPLRPIHLLGSSLCVYTLFHSIAYETDSSNNESRLIVGYIKPIRLLVPVSFTHYCASTPGLSTWSSSTAFMRELVLRRVSRLDAFSGYLFRTLATRRCDWHHNRYTSGSSTPVLSYWEQLLSILVHPRQIGTKLSRDVLNPAHVPL